MKKTLVVGLDAACWEYLLPLLDRGEMPCLQRLLDSGTSGTLQSTMPAWTPTAWSSICTGKNPGKHGVFDMLWRSPDIGELIPIDSNVRQGTPFWKRLNAHNVRVGLVNVPFIYPPEPIDGFMVCGFGTPAAARKITYPHHLLQDIEKTFGRYQPTVDTDVLASASPSTIFAEERQHQFRQVQIALESVRHFPVDVLVINLMFTDHANHKMPEMSQVQEAYRQSDMDLAELIDHFQPDNVMLISDHGSNRLKGNFLLSAWLRDRGYYIEVKQAATQQAAALNWILMQWLQLHHGWRGLPEKTLRRVARELLPRLPKQISQVIWRDIEQVIPFAHESIKFQDRANYVQTLLFPGSIFSGLLYFNGSSLNGSLNGNSQGVCDAALSEQRSKLLSEVTERLLQIKEPETGQPLFAKVHNSFDLYEGPAAIYAPDLILDGYDSGWNIQTTQYPTIAEAIIEQYFIVPSKGRDFGWHSREGILVFSGVDFAQGVASIRGHVMDIPATLLHLYGVPIPQDYDGQILAEAMVPELRQRSVQYQPGDEPAIAANTGTFSQEETAQLVKHLRALGYLA